MTSRYVYFGAVIFVLSIWATSAYAEEQRCTDLGVNCVCSEPLQMTVLQQVETFWYDPNDSLTKWCQSDNLTPGVALNATAGVANIRSDQTALDALPAGHTVQRFFGTQNGVPGGTMGSYVGSYNIPAGTLLKRTALRWYQYYSPDFQFVGECACTNNKFLEVGGGGSFILTHQDSAFHAYNWNGWTPTVACCNAGPGLNGYFGATDNQLRGKWWRWEFVIVNRAGGASPNGIVMTLYGKNITDNGAEAIHMYTGPGSTGIPAQDWSPVDNLTPASSITRLTPNLHRAGTCNGYYGLLNYMIAGWDTDAGQRIGAATEIEGGTAQTIVRGKSLRIMEWLIVMIMIGSASLLIGNIMKPKAVLARR